MKKKLIIIIPIFYACWLAFIFSGINEQADGEEVDLTGTYYFTNEFTKRFYISLLNEKLIDIEKVEIKHKIGRSIKLKYYWKNKIPSSDYINFSKKECVWDSGVLIQRKNKVQYSGILPGISSQMRRSSIGKNRNGNLEFKHTSSEKGLMLYLIPFFESRSEHLVALTKKIPTSQLSPIVTTPVD